MCCKIGLYQAMAYEKSQSCEYCRTISWRTIPQIKHRTRAAFSFASLAAFSTSSLFLCASLSTSSRFFRSASSLKRRCLALSGSSKGEAMSDRNSRKKRFKELGESQEIENKDGWYLPRLSFSLHVRWGESRAQLAEGVLLNEYKHWAAEAAMVKENITWQIQETCSEWLVSRMIANKLLFEKTKYHK